MKSRYDINVDLEKLENNYKYLSSQTYSKILPVIKSDGYGYGIIQIAKKLEKLGVEECAVSYFEEYLKLRKANINFRVYFLTPLYLAYFDKIDKNVVITLHSFYQIEEYIKYLGKSIKEYTFHLNINTGMNRGGFRVSELSKTVDLLKENFINIEGIYSHFSSAGNNKEQSEKQFKEFMKADDFLKERIDYKIRHICNSAGLFLDEKYHLERVRVGMALYGLQPIKKRNIEELKEIVTFKSLISNIIEVKSGERIGYGNSYRASRDMKVAILPIGYADFPSKAFSDGEVLIGGEFCKVIGEVCMEQILVDITHLDDLKMFDEVVVCGEQYDKEISIEDISKRGYLLKDELSCTFSKLTKNYY